VTDGFNDGVTDGFNVGVTDGFNDGVAEGRSATLRRTKNLRPQIPTAIAAKK
jgi:hypothetical protein